MSANDVLLWMSARRYGSWQQFRSASEELHAREDDHAGTELQEDAIDQPGLPLHQRLRFNLQRMGHAEFFAGAGEHDWRVTPPVLAMGSSADRPGVFGIVTGARTLALMERLYLAVQNRPCTLSRNVLPAYPDLVRIEAAESTVLRSVAAAAGISAQDDAAAALLLCLPVISDPAVRRSTVVPMGTEWNVDEFSTQSLRWQKATRADALASTGGLFRFVLKDRWYRRHSLLCAKGGANEVPTQVGKFLVLKRRGRQVLQYDRSSQALTVPVTCGPPFLVERALTMCSGAPPSYDKSTGMLSYKSVPENIARLTSALLRQELR